MHRTFKASCFAVVGSLLVLGTYSSARASGGRGTPTVRDRGNDVPTRGQFDESRAEDMVKSELSESGYADERGIFDCIDCSMHEAGWQWAKDGNACGEGVSQAFNEGCQAYEAAVQERMDNAEQAYEDGDDTFEENY